MPPEVDLRTQQYLRLADFNELFDYPENDRSKKELKRDFKDLNQTYNSKIKFKSLVGKQNFPKYDFLDYYLTSS